ncbi:MAG: hypothetical protein LBT40_05080 [Deltaproteobacteria bacterium]|nr:hypothetical protein [Deltaproteobacteria bacterium]
MPSTVSELALAEAAPSSPEAVALPPVMEAAIAVSENLILLALDVAAARGLLEYDTPPVTLPLTTLPSTVTVLELAVALPDSKFMI